VVERDVAFLFPAAVTTETMRLQQGPDVRATGSADFWANAFAAMRSIAVVTIFLASNGSKVELDGKGNGPCGTRRSNV
jgi:hypothetical protein